MGSYGSTFRGLIANRPMRTHTRDEVQDSDADSAAMEALQSEVRRHPVNLDHCHAKRHPRQGVAALLSSWVFLLIVLVMVALPILLFFGFGQ